jgi:methyl-accepting chemotaxis protein
MTADALTMLLIVLGEDGDQVQSCTGAKALCERQIELDHALVDDLFDVVLKLGQVAQAGAAMDDIVNQVRRVTDLVAEISSASLEQSSGVGQVNQAVAQMDQVTQQNAALVRHHCSHVVRGLGIGWNAVVGSSTKAARSLTGGKDINCVAPGCASLLSITFPLGERDW